MPRQITQRELRRYFKGLPDKYKKKYFRQMVRAGGSVLVKEIRKNVKSMTAKTSASNDRTKLRTVTRVIKRGKRAGEISKSTTSLAKAITQRVKKSRKHGYISVVGGKWPEGAHAHLVERGHRIVVPRGRTQRLGLKIMMDTGKRTRPIPFQRKAEVSAKYRVNDAMRAKLQARVRGERV